MIQSEVLGHSTRKKIYEYIVNNPGVTFQILKTLLDMNEGTLKYHLNYLRKNELIEIKKRKNEKIYLPREMMTDPQLLNLGKQQRQVLMTIRNHPGSDIKEIKSRSRLDRNNAKRVLSSLRRKRLIESKREGPDHHYYPIEEEGLYNEIMLVLMKRYLIGDITLDRLLELRKKLEEVKK